MIGTRVGNYEIKSKIGEGGMGAVYLGEHPLIGKRVAIKVLLEDLVGNETLATRFFNEAKAANDIRHQNIVDIVDFGRLDKEGGGHIFYIVMELLEGESFAERLDAKRLSFDEVRHVMAQCCSGLAASHAKGIIHRDLKPDNLFLVRRGSDENFVKILDFGIAKLTATSETNAKTRTGTLIGTPAYMSPEQCAGRNRIDARSDVYSLGIVMYELLTGHVPFKGEGFGDIVVAHLTEAPKPPSELRKEIPADIEAIVMRAIEKEPEQRFQSMEEFGVALSDPTVYAQSPGAVALAGALAARATTSVPAIIDGPSTSGPNAITVKGAEPSAAMTLVATKKKSNTTLSEAASEVRAPARGGRRVAVIGSAAALALIGGAVAMLKLGGGAPETAPTAAQLPAAAVVAPRPVEEVEVALKSDPPGAQVLRADDADHPVGTTPLTMKVKKGSAPFDVQLKLDGYRIERRTIGGDVNREVDVNLLKQAPAPAAPAPVATQKRERSSPSKPATPTVAPAKPTPKAPDEKPGDDDLIQPTL